MKPKRLKQLLSGVLFAALVCALGVYLYRNRAELSRLIALSLKTVCLMLALALPACVMNALYHKLILDTYHLPLTLTDWLGVVFVANAISYVAPLRADLVFTAAYYKRVHGFAYTKSAGVAAGNIVFGALFALVQLLASLLFTGFLQGQWPWLLWGLLLVGAAGVTALILIATRFAGHMPAWIAKYRILREIITGFADLVGNKALLLRLLVCLTLNNLLHLLLFMACFAGMGITVTLYQALFYNSISRLLSLVAIVPANIGIAQGVMGVAGTLMGDVFESGVVVSLLQAAALMVVYIAMAAVFTVPVWRRWKNGRDG